MLSSQSPKNCNLQASMTPLAMKLSSTLSFTSAKKGRGRREGGHPLNNLVFPPPLLHLSYKLNGVSRYPRGEGKDELCQQTAS